MRIMFLCVLLSVSNITNASCRYGQCEDYDTGGVGPEVAFGAVSFVFICWLTSSESSPLHNYFNEHQGIAWLCLWISPLLGAAIYFLLF